MKAVDLLSERPYILEAERSLPPEEQTVFWIRGLPYDTYLALQEKTAPVMRLPARALGRAKGLEDFEGEIVWQSGQRLRLEFEILSKGLVRVENLKTPDGRVIEYPGPSAPEHVKKEWLARWLPPAVRVELANAIVEGSVATEEEEKNSDSSS